MTVHAVSRYGGIAQLFHWLTALLIVVMYALGWYMADLEFTDPSKFALYQIHKSIGITIFSLAVFRLVWRLTHTAPGLPETMTRWERLAASGAHWALYGLILIQPLVGVLQSNAANFPIVFWGGIELPALIGPSKTLDEILVDAHHLLGNMLAGLVILHAAAALRHHIMLKDDILRRMLPDKSTAIAAVALALALILPPFILIDSGQPREQATAVSKSEVGGATTKTTDAGRDAAPLDALDDPWTIEEGSELGFIAFQQGSEVAGQFNVFDAKIAFDPDDLENSRISVDIDATSIDTGQSSRDDTLKSPSFFDTATWPSAAFESETITATGDGQYEAAGRLTIRDVTKDVVLTFSLDIQPDPADPSRDHAEAKGELPILRLDYGVGQGDWSSTGTVADEVVITLHIKASKPNAGENPSG